MTGVSELAKAGEEWSLRKLMRAGMKLRPLVRDWRASTADMLDRFLGGDEAAKCAVGATIRYYADDGRHLAWPFFAMAQGGFLKSGGVFIKGGSRVLSMKLAKVVNKAGGSVLLGRDVNGIDFDYEGRPAYVRHVDPKTRQDEQRVGAKQVFANCAPHVLAQMLPDAERTKIEHAYLGRPLSISLFSAHFGLSVAPASIGLDRFSISVQPDWATSLNEIGEGARLFSADPGNRLPAYGIANYGAIDSGLGDGPTLVTVVGIDRFDNWAALSPQEEKDRRERWLDAFQAALEGDYPGFNAAVVERMFLNARSMANFMNTPSGAVYGFAPAPFERGIWAGWSRSPRTPLQGVYLASAFAEGGGFSPRDDGGRGGGADGDEGARPLIGLQERAPFSSTRFPPIHTPATSSASVRWTKSAAKPSARRPIRPSRPRSRAGVERRHREHVRERQPDGLRRVAHGVAHRDRRAGERAALVDQLQADAPHPPSLKLEDVRAAGGRRHGVGDKRDPARSLGGDRDAIGRQDAHARHRQ